MPSAKWEVTRRIMTMCLAQAGIEAGQGPEQIAEELMVLRPTASFRQQVKKWLRKHPAALWAELSKAVQRLLQVSVAYECQGRESNYGAVLSSLVDDGMDVVEPGARARQVQEFLQRTGAANATVQAKAKAQAKGQTKAKAKAQPKAKAKPKSKAKAAPKAKAKAMGKASSGVKPFSLSAGK